MNKLTPMQREYRIHSIPLVEFQIYHILSALHYAKQNWKMDKNQKIDVEAILNLLKRFTNGYTKSKVQLNKNNSRRR